MTDSLIQPRPATSQYGVAGRLFFSCHASSFCARHAVPLWLTLVLMLCSNAAMAVNYTFPGSMPLACSGSGGTYTCTALTLGLTDTITIASPKPATITINGAFSASNAKINLAGAVTDLKIIVNGTLTALGGADINANIQATSVNNPLTTVTYRGSINTTTGIVSLGGSSVVSGAIVTTTGSITLGGTTDVLSVNCNCALSVGGLSHIRGNVVAASVTDNINNVAYDGNIATSGTLTLGAGSKVLGSTKSASTTNLVAGSEVVGCVQASNSSTITLGLLAKAGGVCCGNTSCTNSCVVNNTTNIMPPLCGLVPPTPIATYHMDELAWNGTTGEVLDTSANGYNATAAKKLLAPALPTTASSTPAIYGSVGTCGYGVFGAGKYVSVPATFPNLAQNLTITAWINTTDNTTSQRIFVDDQTGLSGYGLSLADGGTGKLRFYRRSPLGLLAFTIDTPNIIQNGNWYFVAVAVDAIGQTGTLYVYDDVGSGTLLASTTGPLGFFGIGDAGTASIGEENALSLETASFTGNIDEINVYNTYLSASDIATARTATHNCPLVNVTPSSFNCVVVGGTAGSGHLYTQLAGTAFNVDVVALKSDATLETGYAAASSKNVTLEWVDGTGSTACASRSALNPAVSQTVTFTSAEAGRKTVSSTISQAYRNLRCRVTDANQVPSIVGCSSDNFAVRPTSFTMSTSANADSTGSSTSATPIIKAGTSFTLTAASGVVGYDGTPAIDSSKLSAHTGAVQTGALTGSFGAANSATGTATGSGFSYSEVGYFRLAANGIYDSSFTAVDSANGDCAAGFTNGSQYACNFGNQAATSYVGRFIPDHFAITQGTATPACSAAFTYYGQDGFNTSFTLNAQNSSNTTTQNYTASFAKLALTSWNNFNFTASGLPAGVSLAASSTAPTGSWLNGTAAVNARHQTNRPASPVVTANAIVSAAPTDSDGVSMTSAAVAAATPLRYGRLFIPNAYGSELLPLAIPIESQYWNGLTYIRNQQDSCTVIPASSIAMGNYRNNLAACETQLSITNNISAGRGALNLSKPGAGNNGSVDLTVNLNTASGTTCNSAVATSATSAALSWLGITSLSSRATFGIYKTPVIYMRENF